MRQTGLLSVTFRSLPVEQIIRLAVTAGLDGIEWGGDIHVPPGDLRLAERVGTSTRNAGLINFAYGSYWRADREPEMIAETAAALGVQWIRIWAGTISSVECPPEIRKKTVKYIRNICRHSNGLQIAAEWHRNTLTDDAESAAKLLNEVGEDNFFCYFQRDSQRDNLRDIAIVPKGRIRAVHVQQIENGQRLQLKDGLPEWTGLIAHIPENVPLLLEFVKNDLEEQFRADAVILKKLAATVVQSRPSAENKRSVLF